MNYMIPYFYLLIGFYYIYNEKIINKYYIGLLIFCSIKIVLNYRKCTISYLEYKIRGVKKEEGYLYNLLNNITDVRYSKHLPILLLMTIYILKYNYEMKNNIKYNYNGL